MSDKLKDIVALFLADVINLLVRAFCLWLIWRVLSDPLGLPPLNWLQCLLLILAYDILTHHRTAKEAQQ